jgi:hypothetical protein
MKYLKLLAMFFVLLMIACDKEDESQSSPIDSIILITATETSSTNEIVLDCRTKKQYQCFNYKIVSTKRTSENSIEISFVAIDSGNICATAFGPATTKINLGVLPIGEYSLTFEIMGEQNNGLLIVTQTQIIFEFDNLEGIEILTPIVQR